MYLNKPGDVGVFEFIRTGLLTKALDLQATRLAMTTLSGRTSPVTDYPQPIIWSKSRRSANSGNCVEFTDQRARTGHIWLRDSKHPEAGPLHFTAAEWVAFVGGTRDEEFDITL